MSRILQIILMSTTATENDPKCVLYSVTCCVNGVSFRGIMVVEKMVVVVVSGNAQQ